MSSDEIEYFILTNIYIDICQKYINDNDLEFDSNYLFNSSIPDFIVGNEDRFVDHKSIEYINFINELINETIERKKIYVCKPAILIIFKLIQIFKNEFDDKLLWLYNNSLNRIQYFDQNDYFQAITLKLNDLNIYDIITLNYVSGSTIYELYESNVFIDNYFEFCLRLFYIDRSNYNLLLSELEWIDTNLNLNNNKYNNLKFMLFLATLQQFMISNLSDRFDFNCFMDITKPPEIKSIKFPIYMGIYIWNKINKNNIINNLEINFNHEDLKLNINKVFNFYIMTNNELFEKIFECINEKELTFGKCKYDIGEIFNSNNEFVSSQYDYVFSYIDSKIINDTNNNTNVNTDIIDLETNKNMICVFGGGYGSVIFPILLFDKISYYVYWIKNNKNA